MTNDKLKLGIVGAGGIAQSYAQVFESCETSEVAAIADVRAEAAQALAEKIKGPRAYRSYETMADEERLDAVLICTPPVTHPEISVHFLRRGVHVLCEKPLCIDSANARMMLGEAKKHGVKLTMASKFRYAEDVVRAKSIVTSGLLGEIILFENAFTSRVNMASRWNSDRAISGGGVLIDNGTHSVDIMRYFLGPLAEVQVVEGKRSQGLDVDETVRVFVRSAGGVVGSVDLSWSIDKEQDNFISIYGSHGTAKLGWKESKYRRSSDSDWVVFGKGYNKVQALRAQIDNFSNAVRKDEPLLITAEDGCASVDVIEAAYAALRESRWTAIGYGADSARGENFSTAEGAVAVA